VTGGRAAGGVIVQRSWRVRCGVALVILTAGVAGCAILGDLLNLPPTDGAQDGDSGCSSEPNGCGPSGLLSVLVPECPFGLVCFTSACNNHDICYTTCGTTQAACDEAFYTDLRAICSSNYADGDLRRTRCEWLAYIYWQAVARFGASYFDGAQVEACACAANTQARSVGASELRAGSMPECPFEDRDDDLLPDEWEVLMGLSPDDPADAMLDFDEDGVTNLVEYINDTDRWNVQEGRMPKSE
jgi:hypothetical protein